jgi:putative flippase GtrA
LLDWQFIRFLLVGGVNAIFGYALFAGFVLLTLPAPLALLLATIGSVVFNYFTAKYLVFTQLGRPRFGRFVLVAVIVYVLNAAALIALGQSALPTYWIQAFLLPIFVALTYLLNKSFVFGPPRNE